MLLTGALNDGRAFLGRGTLRVLRPRLTLAGGDALRPMSPVRVSWSDPEGWDGTAATLSFSRNGGATWQPVAVGLTGTSPVWTVPDTPTRRGLLRVEFRDTEGALATEVLERTFEIAAGVAASGPEPQHIGRLSLRSAPNPFAGGTEITLARIFYDGHPDLYRLFDFRVRHRPFTRSILPESAWGRSDAGRWEWRVSATGRAVPIQRPKDMDWRDVA